MKNQAILFAALAFLSLPDQLFAQAPADHDRGRATSGRPNNPLQTPADFTKYYNYDLAAVFSRLTAAKTYDDVKELKTVLYEPLEMEEKLSSDLNAALGKSGLTDEQKFAFAIDVYSDRLYKLNYLRHVMLQGTPVTAPKGMNTEEIANWKKTREAQIWKELGKTSVEGLDKAHKRTGFAPFSNASKAWDGIVSELIAEFERQISQLENSRTAKAVFSDPGCPACQVRNMGKILKDNFVAERQHGTIDGSVLRLKKGSGKTSLASFHMGNDGKAAVYELSRPQVPLADPELTAQIAKYYKGHKTLKNNPTVKAFLSANGQLLGNVDLASLRPLSTDVSRGSTSSPAPFKVGDFNVTPRNIFIKPNGGVLFDPPGTGDLVSMTEKNGAFVASGGRAFKPNMHLTPDEVKKLSPEARAEYDFVKHMSGYLFRNYPESELTGRVFKNYYGLDLAHATAGGLDDLGGLGGAPGKLGASGSPFPAGVLGPTPPSMEQIKSYMNNPKEWTGGQCSDQGCEATHPKLGTMFTHAKNGNKEFSVPMWDKELDGSPLPVAAAPARASSSGSSAHSNIEDSAGQTRQQLIDKAKAAGKKYLIITYGAPPRCPPCRTQHALLAGIQRDDTMIVAVDADSGDSSFDRTQMGGYSSTKASIPQTEIINLETGAATGWYGASTPSFN